MSDDIKPEPIKRGRKLARATFSIAVTAAVGVASYELILWLTNLRH